MEIIIDIPQKVYDKALSGDGTGAVWAGYVKDGIPLTEWLNSFDTNSATECFTAVNLLKQKLEAGNA